MRLALLVLAIFAADVSAGPLRNRRQAPHEGYIGPAAAPRYDLQASGDALAEVNAARAQRGLRPFILDPALTRAAEVCARLRAHHLLAGHTANDFNALEPGVSAAAAGCGALEPSWGFQSCCQFENWTFAGAATVRGRDGKLYHHLFVR